MTDTTSQNTLTHLDEQGRARMVDVSKKAVSNRIAIAKGQVLMTPETLQKIADGDHAKGDVLAVARVAGIMAAKKCPELIPMCHPLLLNHVEVNFVMDWDRSRVLIEASCGLEARTGVEMEALTAVSVAGLTIYDMCKAVDKHMVIGEIHLSYKEGGKSGDFHWDKE
ncbi:cyclic pyranopterin monophosphate synthase accessory protein [Pseudohongiella nitratireducens]|uniref:Cyclic pyranopterin monophosphate synthase n=1 Tax=Pseudohongiella nitratireducens TaxID=1768907 RepID=A0A917LPE8_9GAMM|nr:cyclic pyranopterin monophosphate synthase MoaC [Pseudohongiella nitratireducens]GGG49342.1 cyclic pyranopterin monophosphate synthase accessory protein [Pseudohongiella nitratireducens]